MKQHKVDQTPEVQNILNRFEANKTLIFADVDAKENRKKIINDFGINLNQSKNPCNNSTEEFSTIYSKTDKSIEPTLSDVSQGDLNKDVPKISDFEKLPFSAVNKRNLKKADSKMSKNKKQKVMKKKKQKKKVNIDEIFNPPSLKLNEMQEKVKITSDSILAQHFTVTHGHKACAECQKITKSSKITQLLKEANLHPNALEYLKHKYPFGCSQNFREATFGASMVTNVPKTILSMLEGAITRVRPLFLKNQVHITDPNNSIKKFRRQLTKRKQDPHSCSIERILGNKQSKDSLLQL